MDENIFINIAQLSTGFIEIPSQVSLNIYAQGCKKRCSGCQNPDLQSFEGGRKLYLKDLKKVLSDFSLCNWICWLGGDAVYQVPAFQEFNKCFQKHNLKVCLYTGLLFNDISDVITDVDLVIDGEWKGTTVQQIGTNQTIHIKDKEGRWVLIETWNELKKIFEGKRNI